MTATWQDSIVAGLKMNNITLIAQVADRVLAPIISTCETDPDLRVVTLTREEEGIGILTGAYLGGIRGALFLQSSGAGNILNALGSLAIPYQIPFVLLLSPRGGFHEHNVVQLAWGDAVPQAFATIGIQLWELSDPETVEYMVDRATKHAFITRRPVVLSISTTLSGGKDGR